MLPRNLAVVAGMAMALPALAQVLTQNSDTTTITAGNSVSCNTGTNGTYGHNQTCTENHYWRSFNLNTEGAVTAAGFQVNSVQFGSEFARHPAGTQNLTVRVYKDTDANPAPIASLVLKGSGTVAIANTTAPTFFSCNISPNSFAKTDFLVVEIQAPDLTSFLPPPFGTSTSTLGDVAVFFIGSNAAAETAPSYLSTADCGIAEPLTVGGIGFPNMHQIMMVTGQVPAVSCYADCDGVGGLTGNDFQCFLNKFVANDTYADCDGVGGLTGNDFQCFLDKYVAGCS